MYLLRIKPEFQPAVARVVVAMEQYLIYCALYGTPIADKLGAAETLVANVGEPRTLIRDPWTLGEVFVDVELISPLSVAAQCNFSSAHLLALTRADGDYQPLADHFNAAQTKD